MIPQNVLSTTAQPAPFLPPDGGLRLPLRDFELGGIALRDPSQGLQVQVWEFTYAAGGVYAQADSVAPALLFSRAGVTELAGCFDQNMNPAVAFVASGALTLWWFDSIAHAQVFTDFTGENPRLSLDDKRTLELNSSDIIFTYLRAGKLYTRTQRERFGTERMMADVTGFYLDNFGMNSTNRLQWSFKPVVPA